MPRRPEWLGRGWAPETRRARRPDLAPALLGHLGLQVARQRCRRLRGKTSWTARINPGAPSETTCSGSARPRALGSRRQSRHLAASSLVRSSKPSGCLAPDSSILQAASAISHCWPGATARQRRRQQVDDRQLRQAALGEGVVVVPHERSATREAALRDSTLRPRSSVKAASFSRMLGRGHTSRPPAAPGPRSCRRARCAPRCASPPGRVPAARRARCGRHHCRAGRAENRCDDRRPHPQRGRSSRGRPLR